MSLLQQNTSPFPRLFARDAESDDPRFWPDWSRVPLGWRLFGLFLLCLVPRVWMACLVRAACYDSYYYISLAAAGGSGNWTEAFNYLNLNIFPLLLLGINSLGLDWLIGGKIWSVLASALVVLPLFGWVRRLFCDQIAWAACFLYTLHAEFVEFSIEPVRDPTFWLLFNVCLYTTLRAISEVKLRWFLAGGLSIALAVHTRSEGWLLTIPFAMWLARQLLVNSPHRKSLVLGGVLWLAVTPLLIVLINVSVLRGEAEWKLGRLTHFQLGWHWLMEQWNPAETSLADTAQTPAVASPPTGTSTLPAPPARSQPKKASQTAVASVDEPTTLLGTEPASVRRYFKELASALEQINLGLLVFGLCCLRRELWNWDRSALFFVSFALAGAVWIFYDHYGVLNGRYFYPIYLALMPYFGTGLLVVCNALWNWTSQREASRFKPQHGVIFLALFSIGLGWADAFTTNHEVRDWEAELGEWIGAEYGPFDSILTDLKSSRPGYHVHNAIPTIMHHWEVMESECRQQPCDLLMLSAATTPPEIRPLVEAKARRFGLEPITLPPDQHNRHRFLAFARLREKRSAETTAAHNDLREKTLRQ